MMTEVQLVGGPADGATIDVPDVQEMVSVWLNADGALVVWSEADRELGPSWVQVYIDSGESLDGRRAFAFHGQAVPAYRLDPDESPAGA